MQGYGGLVWFSFICKGEVLTKIMPERLRQFFAAFFFYLFISLLHPSFAFKRRQFALALTLLGKIFILLLWALMKQILEFLFILFHLLIISTTFL